MHKKKVVFSVIIPVYNRGSLVAETIESVLNQNFSDYEIIAVNDGSTDNSLQVLNQYKDSVRIINQQNQGAEIARNKAVEYAVGDYLVFLDSDDILLPESLSIYHQMIQSESNPALIFARACAFMDEKKLAEIKNEDKSLICYTPVKDYLSKTETVWLSTSILVFKRALWNEKTCFQKGTVDDLDFMLRIGTIGPVLIVKSPATVAYRLHPGNSIHDILINLIRLNNMLSIERKGEYPGGHKRKMERMAVIGGHIFLWSIKGIKKRHYKESIFLLIKGMPAIFAGALKKIKNRKQKIEIKKISNKKPEIELTKNIIIPY
ncbi:MAG: glycosyltransferase family 2 protein [Fibrobacter sp.]|nr:glycosyltransferase family 2 protein [Fibrobacter sp.]